jgi:hypothetical protein
MRDISIINFSVQDVLYPELGQRRFQVHKHSQACVCVCVRGCMGELVNFGRGGAPTVGMAGLAG